MILGFLFSIYELYTVIHQSQHCITTYSVRMVRVTFDMQQHVNDAYANNPSIHTFVKAHIDIK